MSRFSLVVSYRTARNRSGWRRRPQHWRLCRARRRRTQWGWVNRLNMTWLCAHSEKQFQIKFCRVVHSWRRLCVTWVLAEQLLSYAPTFIIIFLGNWSLKIVVLSFSLHNTLVLTDSVINVLCQRVTSNLWLNVIYLQLCNSDLLLIIVK